MKHLKFLIIGIIFGIILSKSEVVSWYRIYEMFKFQSFHMYGVIGSAVAIGIVLMQLFKRGIIKDFQGNKITVKPKKKGFIRTFVGGSIFGLGWAITGACPGPLFAQIGSGYTVVLVTLISALAGTWLYGKFEKYFPN